MGLSDPGGHHTSLLSSVPEVSIMKSHTTAKTITVLYSHAMVLYLSPAPHGARINDITLPASKTLLFAI